MTRSCEGKAHERTNTRVLPPSSIACHGGAMLLAMAEYAATHNIPYSEFLFRLLEAEIIEKQERSIQTLIKLSKLPYRKTIDTFDFTALPSVDERRIRELLTLSFIDRKENILFLGLHRGLERRTWPFRLEWRRSQEGIKRILLPPMIW